MVALVFMCLVVLFCHFRQGVSLMAHRSSVVYGGEDRGSPDEIVLCFSRATFR